MSQNQRCRLIQGKDLKDMELYRIMNPDLVHHEFQWKMGKNTDTEPFYPDGVCQPGGLYFTTSKYLLKFVQISDDTVKLLDHWLARVTVDPDEDVWCEEDVKWKAHRVTVHSLTRIGDMSIPWRMSLFWNVRSNILDRPLLLEYVVKHYWIAMIIIEPEFETDDLVNLALSCNSHALRFIYNQTFESCCDAVKHDYTVLHFILDYRLKLRVSAWLSQNNRHINEPE